MWAAPGVSNQIIIIIIIIINTEKRTQENNQNAFTILVSQKLYLQPQPTNGWFLPSLLYFHLLTSSFIPSMASILQFFLSLCLLHLLISLSAASNENEIPKVQSPQNSSFISHYPPLCCQEMKEHKRISSEKLK